MRRSAMSERLRSRGRNSSISIAQACDYIGGGIVKDSSLRDEFNQLKTETFEIVELEGLDEEVHGATTSTTSSTSTTSCSSTTSG